MNIYIYVYTCVPIDFSIFSGWLPLPDPAPPLGRSRTQDTPVEGGWHNSEIAKSN